MEKGTLIGLIVALWVSGRGAPRHQLAFLSWRSGHPHRVAAHRRHDISFPWKRRPTSRYFQKAEGQHDEASGLRRST
jgi:hypothetical protein